MNYIIYLSAIAREYKPIVFKASKLCKKLVNLMDNRAKMIIFDIQCYQTINGIYNEEDIQEMV